eukprot:720845-Alexandrium_andersonii.AAC.1
MDWGQLSDGRVVRDVVAAGSRPAQVDLRKVASWSVRWLVNPRHHRAKAKRARIMKLLNQGAVVALQETH